jgi:hypothetical protein
MKIARQFIAGNRMRYDTESRKGRLKLQSSLAGLFNQLLTAFDEESGDLNASLLERNRSLSVK